MLTKWRSKRETKRLQAQCPHDWYVIRSFNAAVGACVFTLEFIDLHDIYCPKCNAQLYEISDAELERIEGRRKADRLYGKFRKGESE